MNDLEIKFLDREEAADLLRRMCLADERVEVLEQRVLLIDEQRKIAKGELAEALERRKRLSDEIRHPKPFFEAQQERTNKAAAALSLEDMGEWDAIKLDELSLPEGLLERLAEHNITTIGRVRQLTAAGRSLRELKGIGDDLAAKVADAISDKWSEFTSGIDAAAFMAAESIEREVYNETDEDLSDAGLRRVFACNKCNAYREPETHPCPACKCPEYRVVAVPVTVPIAPAPPARAPRKKRAKAGV